jgi:hypothetical protein
LLAFQMHSDIGDWLTSNFEEFSIWFGYLAEDGVGVSLALTQQEIDTRLRGLLKKEQVNCYSHLERMRFQPRAKSKINIPVSYDKSSYSLVVFEK